MGDDQRLGAGATNALTAVQLALTFPLWVRRRKWTFSYIDDTTIRRHQSVDFRWPDLGQFGANGPNPGDEVLVPLWIARKVPLNDFDIVDERGEVLSLRNQYENGRVASLGMTLLLSGLAAARGVKLSDRRGWDRQIWDVVAGGSVEASRALDEVLKGNSSLGCVLKVDDEHRALLRDLAEGFMVLVPLRYEPGRSRVIKLSFQTPHYWYGRQGERWWIRHARNALASIGWADKRQEFPRLPIGHAGGTHFQIEAPEEVELSKAALTTRQFVVRKRRRVRVEVKRRRVVYDQPTASLNVSIPTAAAPGQLPLIDAGQPSEHTARMRSAILAAKSDDADLEVRFRPQLRGTFAPITIVTSLTAVLLMFGKGWLAHLDGETGGALLLLVPAVLAVWLARPGEHAFVSRLLTGVRFLGLCGALCSLALAALIASGSITAPAIGRATPVRARCMMTGRLSVPKLAPQAVRLRLSCSSRLPTQLRKAVVTPAAKNIADIAAWVATGSASILLAGFLRTWIVGILLRDRDDEEKPLVS